MPVSSEMVRIGWCPHCSIMSMTDAGLKSSMVRLPPSVVLMTSFTGGSCLLRGELLALAAVPQWLVGVRSLSAACRNRTRVYGFGDRRSTTELTQQVPASPDVRRARKPARQIVTSSGRFLSIHPGRSDTPCGWKWGRPAVMGAGGPSCMCAGGVSATYRNISTTYVTGISHTLPYFPMRRVGGLRGWFRVGPVPVRLLRSSSVRTGPRIR